MGVGITRRTLEISGATALRDGLQTRPRRTERVRPGSIRSLGEIVSRGRSRSELFTFVNSGNKTDNFWMMGDTGPCGPCSEVHVDLTPDGDTRGALVNKEDPRCIEIWNLVFIQFNANPDGIVHAAAATSCRYRDGVRARDRDHSRHEKSDRFLRNDFELRDRRFPPDLRRAGKTEREKIRDRTLPKRSATHRAETRAGENRHRVSRHRRSHPHALSFAIADGIIPSNEGRGYVLRRILRRAVRYGRTFGFHEPFFFKLVDVVAKTMGDVFPEVRAKQKTIKETIRREEEAFNKTLDRGIELFEIEALALQ